MKILVTGAGGFLGSVIRQTLEKDHEIIGLGLQPGNAVVCDLSSRIPDLPQADLVVHAAGLAHRLGKNAVAPHQFFDVNVKGTINLLNGLEKTGVLPRQFVFISSVAVYGRDSGEAIDETYPLVAADPYGQSKIAAEQLVTEWGSKHGIPVLVFRLPLVAGPNPPGNLGAMLKAIQKGYYFRIGSGSALRSFVHAADVARLLPLLPTKQGVYNLTSGHHLAISEIDTMLLNNPEKKIRHLPLQLARIAATVGDWLPAFPFNTVRLHKLTDSLTFSDRLARKELGWNPDPRFRL